MESNDNKEMNLQELKEQAVEIKEDTVIVPPENKPEAQPDVNGPDEGYQGKGVVIENSAPKSEAPRSLAPGVRPETTAHIDEYLKEMDEDIEQARLQAEQKAAEERQKQQESGEDQEEEEFDAEKYAEAIIHIDKLGMGRIINFTDAEREKLERVNKIKLEEVETIEVKTFKSKKSKKNSLDQILQKQVTVHTTPIIAPASGYTAVLGGCSTYELIGLIQRTDNTLLDLETRWTIIHKKLQSTSIGDKMDFNTFLRNTAASDYNTFIYGILCSTYPEDDKITLKCQNADCAKDYEHEYTVQSLIRAEKISERMQHQIGSIVDGSHTVITAKEAFNKAPLNVTKHIKLPSCGFILELQVQSAYDLIHNSVKGLSENKEERYNQASILSVAVRSAYIPDPDAPGEYLEYDSAMDVTKIIYNLQTVDLRVLNKHAEDVVNDVGFEFGLMNVTCPHCGEYHSTIPIDLDEVLFHKYQQGMNTEVE